MSCLFPPGIIFLMYFLFLWSRDLLVFRIQSRNFKLFVSRPLWSRFQVFFEYNCCGCTVVCESSKDRLSIPLVATLVFWIYIHHRNLEKEQCFPNVKQVEDCAQKLGISGSCVRLITIIIQREQDALQNSYKPGYFCV